MNIFLVVALLLGIASCCCLVRVAVGPTLADRMVGLDTLTPLVVALLFVLGIYYQQDFYIDVAFVYVLFSFIATLAVSKYLEGRGIGA